MIRYIFYFTAKDGSNNDVTVRFATSGLTYGGNFYDGRIIECPVIRLSPNDGGTFSFFEDSSIGNIVLTNNDGGLNYLADYAVDGRMAYFDYHDTNGDYTMPLISCTITRMLEQDDNIIFALKGLNEVMNDAYPMSTYLGDNVAPGGLEGGVDIDGQIKPKVFGMCKNISPVLVNEQLLIYQASDRSNSVITAVYDDGVKLQDYQISHTGGYLAGATSLDVAKGHGGLPINTVIAFADHPYTYKVTSGIAGTSGTITINANKTGGGGLYAAVSDKEGIAVVGFFTSTSALQSYSYFVSGKQIVGTKTIPLITGAGNINAGDKVHFSGHNTVYTVATGITSPGNLVLTKGLSVEVQDGELIHTVGSSVPWLWGSYQGYFRLTGKPKGQITCDVISIDSTSNTAEKPGDIINSLLSSFPLALSTISGGFLTNANSYGYMGLFISDSESYNSLLGKIAKSIGGYFYISGYTPRLSTLAIGSPNLTLSEHQIIDIQRLATGSGANGIPNYSLKINYDRYETVQPIVAGSVGSARRQRLKRQYKHRIIKDNAVKTRYPTSLQLEFDSLLCELSSVNYIASILNNLIKTRRDIVNVTIPLSEFSYTQATYQGYPNNIGLVVTVTTRRLGYNSGRNMLVLGYEIDFTNQKVRLTLYG